MTGGGLGANWRRLQSDVQVTFVMDPHTERAVILRSTSTVLHTYLSGGVLDGGLLCAEFVRVRIRTAAYRVILWMQRPDIVSRQTRTTGICVPLWGCSWTAAYGRLLVESLREAETRAEDLRG